MAPVRGAGAPTRAPPVSGTAGGGAAGDLVEVFRRPEFNVATFVRDATSQGHDSASRLAQKLEDVSSAVDEELRREIASCHEELLQNAGRVNDLDGELAGVREVVEALKISMSRLRNDVLSPFHCVKRRAQLLERMQEVNVLIRKLLRFLFDARKLRTQMEAPTKDYSKAAHTLHELESVLRESTLERVDVLCTEIAWIREIGAKMRKQAEDDLRSGIRQGNQIALSVALQVFFNLRCMWPQLQKGLNEMIDEFSQSPLSVGASFQQSLEVNLQVLVAHMHKIHLLDEIIRSKTDALTHRSFSTALEDEGVQSLSGYYWTEATKRFAAKVLKVAQDRTARKALITDFPKTLQLLTDAMERVSLSSRGRARVLRGAEREELYAAFAELRNEFLGESIRRVTEPVEMMLPDKLLSSLSATGEHAGGGAAVGGLLGSAAERSAIGESSLSEDLPTSHDIKRYVQLLVAELERNECCPDLLLKEAVRNVRSSVLLFATRLEQVVDSSCLELRCFEDDAGAVRLRSPLPMPVAGHARNARLFGISHHTLQALKEIIPSRFQVTIVTQQVQSTLQQTQSAIVSPMVGSLRRAVWKSALLLGPGLAEGRTADGSPTLLAVSQACAHTTRYYFSLFGTGQLAPYLKDLCVLVVRTFLSAAVLVKPLTEATRAALAQDMQAIETTLSAIDSDFQTHVRHEASVLKEFRKLLFEKSHTAAELDELANFIPLPLLFTFLVHQLPSNVPTIYAQLGVTAEAHLEATLLPLWEEEPGAVEAQRVAVRELLAKCAVGPDASPAVTFLWTRCSAAPRSAAPL